MPPLKEIFRPYWKEGLLGLFCVLSIFIGFVFGFSCAIFIFAFFWIPLFPLCRLLRVSLWKSGRYTSLKSLILLALALVLVVSITYSTYVQAQNLPDPKEKRKEIKVHRAWAFGGEYPFDVEVTNRVREKDEGKVAPTTHHRDKTKEYFVNGRSEYFHALSLEFDITDLFEERDTYEPFLCMYIKKGGFEADYDYHHYIIQVPTILASEGYYRNGEYDNKTPRECPRSITDSFGNDESYHWKNITLSDQYWLSGKWVDSRFWIQIRIWNGAVDAAVLTLIAIEPIPTLEAIFKLESWLMGFFLYGGAGLAWIVDRRILSKEEMRWLVNQEESLWGFVNKRLDPISRTIFHVITSGLTLRGVFSSILLDKLIIYPPIRLHRRVWDTWWYQILSEKLPLAFLKDQYSGPLGLFYLFASFIIGIYSYLIIIVFTESK